MIQLIVTPNDDGQIQVQGPLADKIACYGLLEIAKEAVRNHK